MKLFTLLVAAFASSALHATPVTVYDNTTNDTLNTIAYSTGPYREIGDQIHLGGAARVGTGATVQFYENGGGGTFDATLSFYAVTAGGGVGALLGSFVNTGVSINAADVLNVTWALPNLTLLDDMIFTVSISNVSAGMDLGLDLFDAPTLGTSSNQFYIVSSVGGYAQASTGGAIDNLFFRLDADEATPAPEPGSAALVLCGVLSMAAARRVRPKARRSA